MGGLDMIDTHMHIFDASLVADDPGLRYRPTDSAFLADFRAACEPNGMNGCLFVQPSFLKYDNSYFAQSLDTAETAPFRTWGVAVLDPATGADEVAEWAKKGVIGIRLNMVKKTKEAIADIVATNAELIRKVDAENMHLELHIESDRLLWLLDLVTPLIRKVVIDHYGLPVEGKEGAITAEPAAYKDLRKYAALDRLWFKTSGAYRVCPTLEYGEAVKNCIDLTGALAEMLPADHLLWGSDWPHTQHMYKIPGATPQEKYKAIADSYPLWSQNGKLYDSDKSLAALIG